MIRHLQMILTGKVENTGFRLFVLWGAREMQISGEVKQVNGTILISAEGEEINLEGFTAWCKKGPAGSQIETLYIQEDRVVGYTGFKIL